MTEFQPNALCFGLEFPASGEPCLVQVEDHGITVMFLSGAAEKSDLAQLKRGA